MSKNITCYIANPSFGKSQKDDELTVEQLNNVINVCLENNCKNLVICGGMYSFSKKQIHDVNYVRKEIEKVSQILPTNLNIKYRILSGGTEIFVLRRNLINMNKELADNRSDVEHLGFDRVVYKDTLLKCNYSKQNNIGYNDGEFLNYKGHTYDPSIRLNNIIKDYTGDLVLIGGKNRFEEFVYNNRIVIALPSIMNSNTTNMTPDIGFIMIDRNDNSFDVKQHVKILNKKPEFK